MAKRYSVSLMALHRWDQKPELGFPPPHLICGKKYREIELLDAWDELMAARARTAVVKKEDA